MTFPGKRAALYFCAHLEEQGQARFSYEGGSVSKALAHTTVPQSNLSYECQLQRLNRNMKQLALGLVLLAGLLGCLAVPSAFTSATYQNANIFWLLALLLGTHFIGLFIWLISLFRKPLTHQEEVGVTLGTLRILSLKLANLLQINKDVQQAFMSYRIHTDTRRWLMGLMTHSAWGTYLLAAWLTTFLLLLTKQVNFVWETSLLDETAFASLTSTLAWLPSGLGITMPTSLDIQLSQLNQTIQQSSTRQHWANFILAALFLYGVLPRLLLALYCLIKLSVINRRLPYSVAEQNLLHRLNNNESQQKQILDRDTKAEPTAPEARIDLTQASTKDKAPWALFEWSAPLPKELSSVQRLIFINHRADQKSFIAQGNDQKTYLLIDTKLSPDRGSERFLQEASKHYPNLCLALFQGHEDFKDDWLRLASKLHIACTELAAGE
ncbi:hypothetical protein GCM10027340_19040 [Marinomonas epiphytica]